MRASGEKKTVRRGLATDHGHNRVNRRQQTPPLIAIVSGQERNPSRSRPIGVSLIASSHHHQATWLPNRVQRMVALKYVNFSRNGAVIY
ncbi:unnamed protein product [Prunus armeniaca]|uniref:Uncharacterized protein n=1 Tax=Prunus armeniaca TaxID=36596 RepID=A0A6J5VJA6_PRUAR|nr:unnamed protein product [Prunus armeniaca]